MEERLRLYEDKWDTAARKAYKASHPDNFAGDDLDYPIKDANDAKDAWDLARGPNQDAIRAKVKAIAARLGLSHALPDTAKESADARPFAPKPRIATLTTRFLKYGAISKNGRIYPRETCDTLVRSAQRILDADETMLTCYTSHDAADQQDPIKLSGKITRVWQEGDDSFASFDIPDTSAGRDMVGLVMGGYLKTMSLRAKNAELRMEKGYDLPVVRGNLQLEGIDFAPTPGLPGVAQIQGVALESDQQAKPGHIIDTFLLETSSLMVESAQSNHHDELQEANVSKLTEHQLTAIHGHLQEAHGHLHEMCMGGAAKEAGRAISKANMDKVGAAHDGVAKALGVQCRYTPGVQGNDGDTDGDEATESEDENMTPEEARKLLEAAGYKVEEPKSNEQKLREEFEAKLAEQQKQFDAKLAALTPQGATPQRQTLVEGANVSTQQAAPVIYRNGAYLKEQLQPAHWAALADRSNPWPKDVSPKLALKEMGAFLSARITVQEAAMQGIVL